jgi:hypothetical protein
MAAMVTGSTEIMEVHRSEREDPTSVAPLPREGHADERMDHRRGPSWSAKQAMCCGAHASARGRVLLYGADVTYAATPLGTFTLLFHGILTSGRERN